MIELADFSKSYDGISFAAEHVNLKAEKGCITGLLGLNGAGKTTIIKAICGIHYKTSGTVLVSDREGNFFEPDRNIREIKKHTGYVPENSDFPQNLTVRELLYFSSSIHEENSGNFEEKLEYVSSTCSLTDVLSKKISTLSKGFRQRVSFAQALIYNPANLILDEPVNGLDPAQIIQFRKMILKASEDKTVLLSTHLMQEVEALCQKVYIISGKTVAAYGTPAEIAAQTGSKNIEEAFMKITGAEK